MNNRKRRQGCTGRAAFTLVELLVTIAVICLLLSIIVPVFSLAKGQAYRVVCQSQIRQWGFAFGAYEIDNNSYYPHTDAADRAGGIADKFGWVDMLPPLMGKKPWYDHPIWQRPTTGIYQCPNAKPGGNYGYKIDKLGYFSYAMNSCLELDNNCWPPYGNTGDNDMPSFLKTDKIRQPFRVILLFDQLLDTRKGFGGFEEYPMAGRYCGSYPKAFSARHFLKRGGLGGSILYCDYHIEWKETVWKDEWPIDDPDFMAPPRDDPDWYPY